MYQSRWTVKARVTNQGDVRTWSNAKGEGSLFSCEILDSSGVDLRFTFFKEAVDRFYEMLEVDGVYTFSNGKLKVANAQYNTCKSSFECTFDQNAEIHRVDDDNVIQQNIFKFVPNAEFYKAEPTTNVDLLTFIGSVAPVGVVRRRC